MSEKPLIEPDTGKYDTPLLDELISQLGSLASVYHKPPSHFVTEHQAGALQEGGGVGGEGDAAYVASEDYDGSEPAAPPAIQGADHSATGDLLGFLEAPAEVVEDKPKVLAAEQSGGLEMHAEFRRSGGSVVLDLTLKNGSGGAMSGFHIQFNKNACGLKPPNTRVEIDSLPPGTYALPPSSSFFPRILRQRPKLWLLDNKSDCGLGVMCRGEPVG